MKANLVSVHLFAPPFRLAKQGETYPQIRSNSIYGS